MGHQLLRDKNNRMREIQIRREAREREEGWKRRQHWRKNMANLSLFILSIHFELSCSQYFSSHIHTVSCCLCSHSIYLARFGCQCSCCCCTSLCYQNVPKVDWNNNKNRSEATPIALRIKMHCYRSTRGYWTPSFSHTFMTEKKTEWKNERTNVHRAQTCSKTMKKKTQWRTSEDDDDDEDDNWMTDKYCILFIDPLWCIH